MKIIYHFVLVAAFSLPKAAPAHDDPPGTRTRSTTNGVNQEFRRSYNVAVEGLQTLTNPGPRHKTCEAPKVCKAPSFPGLSDYTDFMFNFTNFTSLQIQPHDVKENDCTCLNDKFREELGPRFLMEMNKERSEVNEQILKSASKKFLNDYASNIEDASFFLLKTSGVFTDEDSAKDIQCNDYRKFDDMIKVTCGSEVLKNPAGFEEKKLALLNALGGASRPGMNFDQRIRDISRQIQFLPIPGETNRDGKQLKFSRTIYDNSRIGLSRSPEGRFVEHIVQKMIQNPEIEALLNKELDTKTPIEAVMGIIENNLGGDSFLNKIGADKNITGNEFTNIKDIREDFKFLMQTHPGFLNVMGRPSTFKLLMTSVKAEGSLSLLEQLETRPVILGPLLVNRCDDLTKQFADIVCTKEDDLIKSVDAADLEEIMHAGNADDLTPEESGPELHELLMCLESGKDPKAAFGHLADLEKDNNFSTRRSDYLERLVEPDIEKHKNLFSVTMLRSVRDRHFRKEMERYAKTGQTLSSSISSPGVVAFEVYAEAVASGNDFSIGKPTLSRSQARDYLKTVSESKSIASIAKGIESVSKIDDQETVNDLPESRKIDRTIASEGPATSYSSSALRQGPSEFKTIEQRQVLSRDLARSNPLPDVQRHVSRLDDETISELASLKNMSSNLMSQMIADEERKLQDYRDRLNGISSTIPLLPSPNVSLPETPGTELNGTSERAPEASGSPILAGVSRLAPPITGNSATSNREEEATVSPIQETRRGGETSASRDNSELAALTIISSQRAEVSELRPEVIESEVSLYLEQKELAPHEFEELLKNGLKYRYQVMVNDVLVTKEKVILFHSLPEKTRRELETKYARTRIEVQASRLAVLKMLMNSTVVR